MSIAELTAKIEGLSPDDYNMVIMLVNRLSEKSEASELVDRLSEKSEGNGLRRLSEDELVKELTESIQKSDKGVTKPARTVSKSMREKYAV